MRYYQGTDKDFPQLPLGAELEYYNQQEDYADSLRGQWYFFDDKSLAVWGGTFANDHSPGASHYTWAEVYDNSNPDDVIDYACRTADLEDMPEYATN